MHPLLPAVGQVLENWLRCGGMGRVLSLVEVVPQPLVPHAPILPVRVLPSKEMLFEVSELLLLLFELGAGLWPQAWLSGPNLGRGWLQLEFDAISVVAPSQGAPASMCEAKCCEAIVRAELDIVLEGAKLATSFHSFTAILQCHAQLAAMPHLAPS